MLAGLVDDAGRIELLAVKPDGYAAGVPRREVEGAVVDARGADRLPRPCVTCAPSTVREDR